MPDFVVWSFIVQTRALTLAVLASVACTFGNPARAQTDASTQPSAIALLLPGQQGIFADAAEAVRLGFFAAHKASGGSATIQVIEVEDDIEQLSAALTAARDRGVRVAVGPLRRGAVNAIVDGGHAVLPLVTLNFPDRDAGAPPMMIAFGLSAEAEAERVVKIALGGFINLRPGVSTGARAIVLSGTSTLDRRIAQAYVNALRTAGESPETLEVTPAALNRLGRQFDSRQYDAVFLAMNARDASLIRPRIPRGLAIFGTSLVNIGDPAASPAASALAFDLEGVRFVDMPWLLQPDHPAVMVYPQPGRRMTLDTARLYALGIDAYRVAQAWMKGDLRFELDGVTGRLRMDRAQGPRVERVPMSAIYRNGTIEREETPR
ncbi:MAG: penicillin-binding protein activator [Burkholderiaceae bacterium]